MIIGVCGTSLVGRSAVAKLLIDRGFSYFSIQNEIVEDMGKDASDLAARLAWDVRVSKRSGKAAWVRRILAKPSSGDIVIDGIRHAEEVEFLKSSGTFVLIGIYAPTEVRFKRALAQDVMEKRSRGKVDPEEEDELDEFRVLKFVDYSIPFPAKDLVGQVENILKEGRTARKP